MGDYTDLEKPVSAEQPCGPDPDGNPEIQNFLSVAEGQLPATYREFNRKAFDAKPALQGLQGFLRSTRDIRFLILAAKYHILADDLSGFSDAIAALLPLLSQQWEHCHPAVAAGGNELRAAYLKSLDDLPTSVFPLQNATLINDKRLGAISMRSIMVAAKQLPVRAGDPALDQTAIRDAFMRLEPIAQLVGLHKRVRSIPANLAALRQLFIDKAGYETAPQFDQLPELAGLIAVYVEAVLRDRAPAAPATPDAPDGDATSATQANGAAAEAQHPQDIATFKEASSALEAILAYYAANEPSSPSRLLLKQAHQLVGKSFVEAMKILAPGMVDKAKIPIGGEVPFALTFAQLAALPADDAKLREAKPDAETRTYVAATRSESSALMAQVERFYRQTEPSSPIPLLVERARNYVAKGFAELLKEMAKKDDK